MRGPLVLLAEGYDSMGDTNVTNLGLTSRAFSFGRRDGSSGVGLACEFRVLDEGFALMMRSKLVSLFERP